MNLQVTIEVWKKDNRYLARTPELNFISQGETTEEAKKNLLEVINIQFKEMKEMGTLNDYLAECGFASNENTIVSHSEMIGFERSTFVIP